MALNSKDDCVFCNIINDNDHDIILFQNESVVCIKDIKPATSHHYLVISRQHIPDAKHLDSCSKTLIEEMSKVGREMLENNTANMSDARYGFHWPPFTSVKHLHLHAMSPASEMSFLKALEYKPNTWWFVTPEYVLSRL